MAISLKENFFINNKYLKLDKNFNDEDIKFLKKKCLTITYSYQKNLIKSINKNLTENFG